MTDYIYLKSDDGYLMKLYVLSDWGWVGGVAKGEILGVVKRKMFPFSELQNVIRARALKSYLKQYSKEIKKLN